MDAPASSLPRRSWTLGGLLGGIAWRLTLAVLILYGLTHLAVRTEWFRRQVEHELSRLTGMDMRVGRIRATEALNLKIRDVISLSEGAGIELHLVRVRWRFFRPRGAPMLESVRVDGWEATFAPDAQGRLQPEPVGATLGQALGWAGIGFPPAEESLPAPDTDGAPQQTQAGPEAELLGLPRLEMRWGTVRVLDAQGNEQASVAGLDLLMASMTPPEGGRVSHLEIRAQDVRVVNGPRIAGLHMELVDTGEQQFLAALQADDWGTVSPPRSREAEYRELLDAMDSPPR